MTWPLLDVGDLLDRLLALVRADDVLAFDGDGTLWSGDVGDDMFFHALDHQLLREAAWPALEGLATLHGLAAYGTTEDVARRIYDAHLAGRVSQPSTYAMMAWCFAGYTSEAVAAMTREILPPAALEARRHPEVDAVLEWARSRGLRTVVISASPEPVVQTVGAYWGFAPPDIVAVTPSTDQRGHILPELRGEVPYGPQKVHLGRELLGQARWLAAFGDNTFDADMLTCAEVGVAVRPKPGLRRRLTVLPGVVELAPA